jgi:hypothetical protein
VTRRRSVLLSAAMTGPGGAETRDGPLEEMTAHAAAARIRSFREEDNHIKPERSQ